MKTVEKEGRIKPKIIERSIKAESRITVLKEQKLENQNDILNEKILVAVGKGVRNKSDIVLFEEFARAIGGALACSRGIVERGWMPQEKQIGLSGKTVSPELLITCGLSGSVQFMAGAGAAKHIIAINADPEAQIFKNANTMIKGDMYKIIPALTDQLKRRPDEKTRKDP